MNSAEERTIWSANDLTNAQLGGNNFSKKIERDIPETTIYLRVISDNHNQLEPLIETLEEASLFPNMKVVFLGDQMNTALKDSKTSVYESKPVQIEVDSIKYAIEKSGIDKNQILLYLDGNHEDREKKNTSIQLGKIVTDSLGISDRYAGNMALLTLNLQNPLNKQEKVPVTIFASHGQGRGGGPGAEADKSLNSFVKGVDIVLAGDTHKVVCANKSSELFIPGTNKKYSKDTFFANLGTDLPEERYLLEKGIPARAVRDGELIKISLIPNKTKDNFNLAVDFVNIRQVLTDEMIKIKNNVNKKIAEYESIDFENKKELDNAYGELVKEIQKFSTTSTTSNLKYPKELKLAVLSGLNIGENLPKQESQEFESKLDEIISTISKLNNCKVILNGDIVFYKKANLLKGENYPEDTFAYLQEVAKKLEPIKDKIIAYNSGLNEANIMKQYGNAANHALKLADIAMKNIQLDHDEAYEPMKASEIRIEKQKIQNKQVEEYNEKVLDSAYKKCVKNIDNIEKLIKYKKEVIDNNPEPLTQEELRTSRWGKKEIEEVLVLKLRKEGVLLDSSTKNGKAAVNKRFPLEDIHLERPNPNLVQNILCKLLNLNPKNIAINSTLNTTQNINSDLPDTCDSFVKITNANGETQGLNIVTSFKPGSQTRKATEKTLIKHHNDADIYISSGREYCTKEQTISPGNVKNIWHISSGRLSDPESVFRIYEIRSEKSKVHQSPSGIYEPTSPITLTCSSKSIKSILTDNSKTDLSKIIKKLLIDSYGKKLRQIQDRERQKTENTFSIMLDKKEKAIKPKTVEHKKEDGGKE